jgi:hypothetical protein
MIRYSITLQDLVNNINATKPGWITRAHARTQTYTAVSRYTGGTDFWGEIKSVYIALQHEKCAYCETKLQGAVLASKSHEVEHYRPKQSVNAWPNHNIVHWADFHPAWQVGGASPTGYYALAYHPFNYAIACTRCNSTLKSNYFPVRGPRDVHGHDPSAMTGEQPLLLYPISTIDPDDPADIITFDGVLAIAKHKSGAAYERAETTIAFFQLNHEDLVTRRSEEIIDLWMALEQLANPSSAASAVRARKVMRGKCSPRHEFSACMNAFKVLYDTTPARAEEIVVNLVDAMPD